MVSTVSCFFFLVATTVGFFQTELTVRALQEFDFKYLGSGEACRHLSVIPVGPMHGMRMEVHLHRKPSKDSIMSSADPLAGTDS